MAIEYVNSGVPSKNERRLAKESRERLKPHIERKQAVQVQIMEEGQPAEVIPVPESVVQLLYGILSEMAEGNAVTLVAVNAEVTTQQAADVLNVSRPHLIHLLESRRIPFHHVGTHRRIRLQDVVEYKRAQREKRLEALEELADQAQELNMGY